MKFVLKTLVTVIFVLGLAYSATFAHKQGEMKFVIQMSDGDWNKINLALNNGFNLIKHYGVGNVEVEIVAYGPGLIMFKNDSKVADRIKSLHAFGGVSYGICATTMKKMKLTNADLIDEAFVKDGVVPGGIVRIAELQDAGYHYIRP